MESKNALKDDFFADEEEENAKIASEAEEEQENADEKRLRLAKRIIADISED